MQPKWRLPSKLDFNARSPPKLSRDLPPGVSMNDLKVEGLNGFFVVLLSLGIWASAREHSMQSSRSLTTAVADILWVLSMFVKDESVRAEKRQASTCEGHIVKK